MALFVLFFEPLGTCSHCRVVAQRSDDPPRIREYIQGDNVINRNEFEVLTGHSLHESHDVFVHPPSARNQFPEPTQAQKFDCCLHPVPLKYARFGLGSGLESWSATMLVMLMHTLQIRSPAQKEARRKQLSDEALANIKVPTDEMQ